MLPDSPTQTPPKPPAQSRVLLPMKERKLFEITAAEEKLLERLRACRDGAMVMVFVGSNGEPKQLFEQKGQIEVLAR